ncbi:transglycosylase SLT domain-containing protein [Moraxella nasicaprae]|uniref:Transglycosylase SLT domain-containing protein n=1 Tax=Moraxella nasicaprae TaxID=2904122 RepID=A0ABY6F4K6_9GAMM|nr:transglycosylase SLT domain-containing protein [Moraxella nasicaprae]UXZ05028.1 transglycosylase SLT domain-containing protein [Moraxella nasicaprae]
MQIKQNRPNTRKKSLYRPTPVRAKFRKKPYAKLLWAGFLTHVARPLLQGGRFVVRHLIQLHRTHPKHAQRFWQVLVLALLIIIPARILLTDKPQVPPPTNLSTIIENKILTVASTNQDDGIIYDHDGLMHGFGYDVARLYASHLGAQLAFVNYANADEALRAVQSGVADVALLHELDKFSQDDEAVDVHFLACDDAQKARVKKAGLNEKLAFITADSKSDIADNVKEFLCTEDTKQDISYLVQFHDQNLLKNAYNAQHFASSIKRLPLYEYGFKIAAEEFEQDWEVLAMVAYQESHLNTKTRSPTGVQGMMMLTQDTAKAMGIKDRNDVVQSIRGGAKYLNQLQQQFAHIPKADRLWFVLASYNMGPNAVKQIQAILKTQGKDPNLWVNVYTYLNQNAEQNSRYAQCVHYVTNIRNYLEAIKKPEQSSSK